MTIFEIFENTLAKLSSSWHSSASRTEISLKFDYYNQPTHPPTPTTPRKVEEIQPTQESVYFKWKSSFAGTVPANKNLFAGTFQLN